MQVSVIGCGFVGSIFTSEFLRRCFAGELAVNFHFVDMDHWERRNAANQEVSLKVATDQRPKAETMHMLAKRFERESDWHTVQLTEDNIDVLKDSDVLVDAVDNLKTRQLLWQYGYQIDAPVVHIGIDPSGTGRVEWSHDEHDTFHLAPQRCVGKTIVDDPPSGVKPPCELAAMRGVGWNASFAAAKAVAMLLGFDPERYQSVEQFPQDSYGWLTDWMATTEGHKPIRELWSKLSSWTLGG